MIPLLKIKIGMKQKISALIPTFNEEHNISDAIDSVSWADEILVVDSFSTDSTIEIAKKKGAKVIQRAYNYPASQKNWAIPQAKNDWIILIDADERIPYDLKTEIINILNRESSFDAFWIRRQNHFMGRKIRFSGWQGDKVIRLFKRDFCRYEDKNVHEEIICNGKVGVLKTKMTHFTFKDINHYLEKWDRYTTWSANERFLKGENPNFYHFVIKPIFRFTRDYFFKLGFLDGLTGFILCILSSMSVFVRSLKIKHLKKSNSN